jgi:hypothetical protein
MDQAADAVISTRDGITAILSAIISDPPARVGTREKEKPGRSFERRANCRNMARTIARLIKGYWPVLPASRHKWPDLILEWPVFIFSPFRLGLL